MTSNMYMYMPIRKQIKIIPIKGGLDTKGLYFVVVLVCLTETKLG